MIQPINSEDPMSTLFKIGDVGILLGINPESIRHYEEYNIVQPNRKNGKYRYYNVWDIRALTTARKYRKLGFSLEKIGQLINDTTLDDIQTAFMDNEAEIEKKITWYMNILKYSKLLRNSTQNVIDSTNKYHIEERPPLYRIDLLKFYQLALYQEKQDLYRSWSQKSPFVNPSALFPGDLLSKGDYDITYGLCIREEFADMLKIKPSKDVTYFPPQPSLYTTIKTSSNMILTYNSFAPIIQYLKEQGLKIKGDVISVIPLTIKEGDIYHSWHQIWVPI